MYLQSKHNFRCRGSQLFLGIADDDGEQCHRRSVKPIVVLEDRGPDHSENHGIMRTTPTEIVV